jgi:hypothetical protein
VRVSVTQHAPWMRDSGRSRVKHLGGAALFLGYQKYDFPMLLCFDNMGATALEVDTEEVVLPGAQAR